jgi:hypothetical protein
LKPERYTCGDKGSPGAALRSWGWGHREEESFCLLKGRYESIEIRLLACYRVGERLLIYSNYGGWA